MALFPHSRLDGGLARHSTRQRRKISIALINNPPGKNCLASIMNGGAGDNPLFTSARQCVASRLFSPASPTASPESEYLSHGCVASRGVCKGAPHSICVGSGFAYRRRRLRRRDVETYTRFGRSGVRRSAL